ncbi:hypothetical protein ACFQHW_01680 [Lapidilactobacillus achengensis]|uniref:Phosphatidic acid phosphatase type 2/haloperoxidase domain-containing protein n=1 Tax=Lapidilactobacillus achengensis TaxID=2486000 RepID=A0ABW1UMM6_9LACO|nr:hypothetical protein [Lapidilactobacillus achengensis]
MTRTEKLAKIIRVITVPPLLVMALLTLLWLTRPTIFGGQGNFWLALLWLGIFPVLAYPLQRILPHWRQGGRAAQRKLAFICSLVGYLGALLNGWLAQVPRPLLLIYWTYALSAVLLTMVNRVTKIRASGHACSVISPIVFLSYFSLLKPAAAFLVAGGLSFWASLKLKRHRPRDLIAGSLVMLTAFTLALLITG